ncbi:hypothetical protein [Marinobacterium aestuariivivens]|uniref:Peptidase M16 C-terminal domain-containing protein n=1 Tax=Marinobacterium aestuariivivens TaxID=1698799 RepID=A0ABW1ZZ62_9GAMM
MPETRKPLFSRRYLKALIWLLPGLILLLASAGPDKLPAIQQSPELKLYWLEQPERAEHEMRLLFDSGAILTPSQRILQQVLAEHLQARLQQPEIQSLLPAQHNSEVAALTDRLQLKLQWPAAQPAPRLGPLLAALAQPGDPAWQQRRFEQQRAQAYLDSQTPDQRLLNLMQEALRETPSEPVSPGHLHAFEQRLFSQPPLVLLGGPAAAEMAAAIGLESISEGTAKASRLHLHDGIIRLRIEDPRLPHALLLGTVTDGQASKEQARERLALAALQHLLEQQPALEFRLVWRSWRRQGYQALILLGEAPPLQPLADQADGALIGLAREQLLQDYRDRLRSPDGQLDRLETIAFYGLPDRQLDTQLRTLEQVPVGDIAARITQYLDPETQIRIELN